MKFVGQIGFWVDDVEVRPGVFRSQIEERKYYGDVLKNYRRFSTSDKQNDDLSINNQISILSDLYSRQNWQSIKYVIWNDAKWKVTSVELEYPRIILDIGGLYNVEEQIGLT